MSWKKIVGGLSFAGGLALVILRPDEPWVIVGVCISFWVGLIYAFSGWALRGDLSSVEKIGRVLIVIGGCSIPAVALAIHAWPQDDATKTAAGNKRLTLDFKDSKLLTPAVKQGIADTVSDYVAYLRKGGIDVPKELPPIGVRTGIIRPGGFWVSSEGDIYQGRIMINEGDLGNRQSVIRQISNYLFTDVIKKQSTTAKNNFLYTNLLTDAVSDYATYSFWGEIEASRPSQRWAAVLWDIRQRYGKDFGDRVAFLSFRMFLSNDRIPPTQSKRNEMEAFDLLFRQTLLRAESVIDNEDARLGEVKEILRSRGFDEEGIRRRNAQQSPKQP